jgi:DNA repair protein RadA/Sms
MATKTKDRSVFSCSECGWTTTKWVGRCGECQSWGTVEEKRHLQSVGRTTSLAPATPARPITEIPVDAAASHTSGISELDRVLGGGLVPGAVALVSGEPGVGKSTLLLHLAHRRAAEGDHVLYVTGEESAAQVRLRAERTGAVHPHLYLAAETSLATILGHIDAGLPRWSLVIVDSVQTINSADVDGVPGGVTQVREVAAALIAKAKSQNVATVLVGHVTKDGSVAGPRMLEHLVDTVLQFEGDPHSRLRLLRAVKNRFGPVDEIGCFDLVDDGLVEVSDPTGLFVSRHEKPVSGTCLTVTMEGHRPLLAEVQSLSLKTSNPSPRRTASGLDSARVAMALAVLARHCHIDLTQHDVYAATVGGARLTEPAVDLAVIIAAASGVTGAVTPPDLVAIGEVGLAGEIRPVRHLASRLREAARLGIREAIIPAGWPERGQFTENLTLHEVADVTSAIARLSLS